MITLYIYNHNTIGINNDQIILSNSTMKRRHRLPCHPRHTHHCPHSKAEARASPPPYCQQTRHAEDCLLVHEEHALRRRLSLLHGGLRRIRRPKLLCRLCRCPLNVLRGPRGRHPQPPRRVGEVEAGGAATQRYRRHVVGSRSHLGRGKSPQPYPGLLVGLPHLADPLAGVPPPHSPVHRVPGLFELLPPRPLLRVPGGQLKLLVRQVQRAETASRTLGLGRIVRENFH